MPRINKEKKEATVQTRVPKDKKEYYSRVFYALVYKDDIDGRKIYEVVEANPHMTASEIAWLLEKEHNIRRNPGPIKNFAKRVGLPIKS